MMKFRVIFAFLFLFTLSLLVPYGDKKFNETYPIIKESQARVLDWSSLIPGQMDRLRRTLQLIKEDYVDPPRIKPDEMLKKALEQLSLTVPEMRVVQEGSQRAVIFMGDKKKEIDTRIGSISALGAALTEIGAFVLQNQSSKLKDADIEATMAGAVLSTLDPHSMFLNKEFYKETQVQTSGHFGGLGIVIGIRDSKLTIITPLEDTPASKAKLKAGDHISKINEESTEGLPLQEAVKRMRGPVGTSVQITIARKGWPTPQDFKLIRDKIIVVSVESHLLPQQIGYVKIKNFQQDTGKSLESHLKSLQAKAGSNLKGLIIDLRNNPGGVLDQSIQVSDHFLTAGTIVSTVGPNGIVYAREDASGKGMNVPYPIIAIVNHGSASASEIVAGALHGNQRAMILGTTSFGKGTVQRIYDLPKESALKLTIAKYLTPGGISIQSKGIVPDVQTEPYIISKNGFNLILKEVKPGESTLEKHFSAVENSKEPVEQPDIALRYLEKIEDPVKDQEIAESNLNDEKLKKLMEDFEVSLSAKIISKATSSDVKELIKITKDLQTTVEKEEIGKLQAELLKQNIDWTSPLNGAKSNKCDVQTSARVLKNNKVVSVATAGDKVDLEVTLKNTSKCTLYRTLVQTESKRFFLDDLEFVLGKVLPGQTYTKTMQIEIPKGMFSGMSEVDFIVIDSSLKSIHKNRQTFAVQSMPAPVFAMNYQIDDKSDGALGKGNADGYIDRGETLHVKVEVENIGKTPVNQGTVDLMVQDGSGLEGMKTHSPLKDLKAGDKQKFDFYITVSPTAKKETASIRLSVMDYEYKAYQTREIDLPIMGALQSKPDALRPPTVQTDLSTHFQQKIKDQFLKVKGTAEDQDGLRDVYIIVNLKKAFYQTMKDKKASFETSIPLEPGENQVLVVARDKDELIQTERYVIVRDGNKAPLTSDEGETILE